MPTDRPERCETCRFYEPNELECRRRAPTFNENCGSIWPQDMKPNDWCGEYAPSEKEAARRRAEIEAEECPF